MVIKWGSDVSSANQQSKNLTFWTNGTSFEANAEVRKEEEAFSGAVV